MATLGHAGSREIAVNNGSSIKPNAELAVPAAAAKDVVPPNPTRPNGEILAVARAVKYEQTEQPGPTSYRDGLPTRLHRRNRLKSVIFPFCNTPKNHQKIPWFLPVLPFFWPFRPFFGKKW
jgi:hypothetical protein